MANTTRTNYQFNKYERQMEAANSVASLFYILDRLTGSTIIETSRQSIEETDQIINYITRHIT